VFALSWGHLGCALSVALHHAGLASLVGSLLSLKLVSVESLLGDFVFFGMDSGGLLHSFNIAHNNHSSGASRLLFGLLPDSAQIFSGDDGCFRIAIAYING
jgi:hypothetical protein